MHEHHEQIVPFRAHSRDFSRHWRAKIEAFKVAPANPAKEILPAPKKVNARLLLLSSRAFLSASRSRGCAS
jgi:hypothetical protein